MLVKSWELSKKGQDKIESLLITATINIGKHASESKKNFFD
jgi:hypothetical protein